LVFHLLFGSAPSPTVLFSLSLHDALPEHRRCQCSGNGVRPATNGRTGRQPPRLPGTERGTVVGEHVPALWISLIILFMRYPVLHSTTVPPSPIGARIWKLCCITGTVTWDWTTP